MFDINILISLKLVDPTKPYTRLVPNKNMHVDKLPIIKYFTPASEDVKSSLLKETKMYRERLWSSIDMKSDNRSFDEIIKSIPTIEIKRIIANSGLFSDFGLLTVR